MNTLYVHIAVNLIQIVDFLKKKWIFSIDGRMCEMIQLLQKKGESVVKIDKVDVNFNNKFHISLFYTLLVITKKQ